MVWNITQVREATEKAKEMVSAQGMAYPVEGPLQFDAAVDPEVAKVKVKTESAVAGKANVCVFPDLNTGILPPTYPSSLFLSRSTYSIRMYQGVLTFVS